MGNLLSSPQYSYHIYKKIDNTYLSWWPLSNAGQYCTDLEDAEEEFEKECKNGPCRLMRRETLTIKGIIIGVKEDGTILQEFSEKN